MVFSFVFCSFCFRRTGGVGDQGAPLGRYAGMGYRYTREISHLHDRSLVAEIRVRFDGPWLQSRRNYIGGRRSLKRLDPY